jgi:hypothetical protein
VTQLTRQVDPAKPGCNPLTFVFFFLLKRCRFEFFFKIEIDPIDPVDPVKTRNPGFEPG